MPGPTRGAPRGAPNAQGEVAALRREVEQLRRELRGRGPEPVVVPVQPDSPPRLQGRLWVEPRPPEGWVD